MSFSEEQLDGISVGEKVISVTEHRELLNKRVKLWNIEFVVLGFLHLWKLLWRWLDVIEDTFIHEEVHEFDPELVLDLALVLDGFFDHVTNLVDSCIFCAAGYHDPVI